MDAWPAVGQNGSLWVEVLSHLLELIAAKQVDKVFVFPQVVANVAAPACWLFPPEHGDAADDWPLK